MTADDIICGWLSEGDRFVVTAEELALPEGAFGAIDGQQPAAHSATRSAAKSAAAEHAAHATPHTTRAAPALASTISAGAALSALTTVLSAGGRRRRSRLPSRGRVGKNQNGGESERRETNRERSSLAEREVKRSMHGVLP